MLKQPAFSGGFRSERPEIAVYEQQPKLPSTKGPNLVDLTLEEMTKHQSSVPNLDGKKVAILVSDGFEQVELISPRKALEQAGTQTEIVSPLESKVRGWDQADWGAELDVDVPLESADPEDYDALLLPGGVMNPDHLRRDEEALKFVRAFFKSGKPVGAICHGPWTLIDAGVVRGRTMTSFESIQSDLKNAGARWQDEEVVVDHGLVTSRKPDDLPAFNRKFIQEVAEGPHSPPADEISHHAEAPDFI